MRRTIADDLDDVEIEHRDEKLPRFTFLFEPGRPVGGPERPVRFSIVDLEVVGLGELAVVKTERDEIRAAVGHDGDGSGVDLFDVDEAEVGQSRPDDLQELA